MLAGSRCGVLLPVMTQPAKKGTTKTKEFSEVTPETGLSHQIDVIWGPLSHQTVLERSDLKAL